MQVMDAGRIAGIRHNRAAGCRERPRSHRAAPSLSSTLAPAGHAELDRRGQLALLLAINLEPGADAKAGGLDLPALVTRGRGGENRDADRVPGPSACERGQFCFGCWWIFLVPDGWRGWGGAGWG